MVGDAPGGHVVVGTEICRQDASVTGATTLPLAAVQAAADAGDVVANAATSPG